MSSFFRSVVGVSVAAMSLAVAPPAHAAATVTFDGTTLRGAVDGGSTIRLACSGLGNVLNNGVRLTPVVRCANVSMIKIVSSGGSTVDLRNVLPAQFPKILQVTIEGFVGGDTFYGSAFGDVISGSGYMNGVGGDDVIRGAGTLLGGDGNDDIAGSFGNDTINGGPGNDRLVSIPDSELAGGSDVVTGGSGDDYIAMTGRDRSASGGLGDDTIQVIEQRLPGVLVIDGNEGNDTVVNGAFRVNGPMRIAPAGEGGFTKAVTIPGGSTLFKSQRVERWEIRDVGRIDVVMSPTVAVYATPSVYGGNQELNVFVPGGEWVQGPDSVTSFGKAPVTWRILGSPYDDYVVTVRPL